MMYIPSSILNEVLAGEERPASTGNNRATCVTLWEMLHVQHCNAMGKCWTVRRSSVQRPIMTNVTWSRFDQSAKQLVVGHTTIQNL